MASDLSEDLVEEILSRVPATSLKRLRSACKQWNALFKDKRFAKKHFAKAAKQFQVLMLKENRVYSMSVNLHEIHNNVIAAPSIEFKVSHDTCIHISHIIHCDGLLLCTTHDYSIVVWNPFLGETRWIQPKTVYNEFTWFSLGYQNTSFCRSYKILICMGQYDPNGHIDRVFEIFDLISSHSWRVLDVVNLEIILKLSGVSLKGNSYWLAFKNNEGSHHRVLLGFDFSTEKFRHLCLPFQGLVVDIVALSVVKEENLVLLHQRFETLKLDIWVTTNIDQTNALSWKKFLAVDLYTHNCRFMHSVNFFIDEEKKVAMCTGERDKRDIVCIIGEDGTYRELSFEESTNISMMPLLAFSYVPSLVHTQQR